MDRTLFMDMLILAFLVNEPRHGYDIKKQVNLILGRRALVNNNQLYPALHRLVERGAIVGEVREQEGRPSRHVYRMTPLGREFYFELLAGFTETEAERDDEFLFRVSQFALLEPATRRAILSARRAVIERRLAHRSAITEVYPLARESPWIARIFAFQDAQFRAELAWIDELDRAVDAAPAARRTKQRARSKSSRRSAT